MPKTRELLAEYDEELLFLDPAETFDPCILGVVEMFGRPPVVCYDSQRCINALAKDMTMEEAEEFFDFNTAGAYAGERTPAFLRRIRHA